MQYENDKLIDAAKEYIQLMKDSGLGYFRIKDDKFEIELGEKHPHHAPPPPFMPGQFPPQPCAQGGLCPQPWRPAPPFHAGAADLGTQLRAERREGLTCPGRFAVTCGGQHLFTLSEQD